VTVALVIQHAKRMRDIIFSSVPCLATPDIFHIISQMPWFSKKNVVEHKICVSIFSADFVWNNSHFKHNSARYCTQVLMLTWRRAASLVSGVVMETFTAVQIFDSDFLWTVHRRSQYLRRKDTKCWRFSVNNKFEMVYKNYDDLNNMISWHFPWVTD
jgi:hypothetical protein